MKQNQVSANCGRRMPGGLLWILVK